jgi:hypothetical protein
MFCEQEPKDQRALSHRRVTRRHRYLASCDVFALEQVREYPAATRSQSSDVIMKKTLDLKSRGSSYVESFRRMQRSDVGRADSCSR